MVFKFLWKEGSDRLESVEAKVQLMIGHSRHEFDLAMAALMGDVKAAEVNDDLRTTDQKVNRLEREVRRELLVHASVWGGIDTPAVLVSMSIVKDIERIGDYAKNLLDLALDGADFSSVEDSAEWRRLASQISLFIAEAGDAFQARAVSRCHRIRSRGDEMLDHFDERVSQLVRGDDSGSQAVSRALAFRYLKRVVAHVMNLLSGVVMPLDQIDYFAEDPEDRQKR
jgi:phosphate uptake regulator